MPYVQRNLEGAVVGVYSTAQAGYAEEWAEDANPEVTSFLNPPTPSYALEVSTFWARMTDSEAEGFDAAMSTASPLRLRKAFNAASTMVSETEMFEFVLSILEGVAGATRAASISARATS